MGRRERTADGAAVPGQTGRERHTEPRGRLTARQERELGEQVERVGEVLEATAESVEGEVTVGPHA